MRIKVFAVFIICMLLYSACRNTSQPSTYLFVEYWTDVKGTTSKERCDDFIYLDGSGYYYDAGTLLISSDIDLNKDKSLLGCGKQTNYPVGSGIFTILHSMKDFPYTPEWADFCRTITINSIDASGTIFAKVNGKTISVAIGQEWTDKITDNSDTSCEKVTSYRVTNFGFINSSQIRVSKE